MASLPAVAPAPKMAALPNFLPAVLSHSPCWMGGGGSCQCFLSLIWGGGWWGEGMGEGVGGEIPLGARGELGGWGLRRRLLVRMGKRWGSGYLWRSGLLARRLGLVLWSRAFWMSV